MRWQVKKGKCEGCGHSGWVITEPNGANFGCRPTFEAAIDYADRKARVLCRASSSLPLAG